ncbi:unnamed protein product [Nippostrongylus brasiliensis]|uniref:V-type proton ATPase subunit a n=1 Tax=Nippostrongylus brasiliensis TaxID=27835 RepID=A0A158R153_NIPBR|nr:unnamed protein product [Nippostrongylus brasiliensis]
MGSLYRSEPMRLCEMILVKDAAYDCVGELGKRGNVQFNDVGTVVISIRWCLVVKRFLERQVVECVPGIDLLPIDATGIETPSHFEINHLEAEVDELERNFVELNKNDSCIRKNLNEMREFEFVAGVIPLDKKNTFERVLWRACRRTAFVRISDVTLTLEDPVTLAPIMKCVFIVFFKGESLKLIVDKVCDGFNARQYPCPKTSKERQSALYDTIARIHDLKIVIDSTKKHRFEILTDVAKDLPEWLKKCWIPEKEMDVVHAALLEGLKSSGCDVSPILNEMTPQSPPPTFHRTNKFTSVFQSIVDSYGVANYREINPAPYTIITFPFLFGVMFGDAAHGLILFLAGLFFIFNEKKIVERRIRDEIFNTFFGGRYIILLMGLFSIYTGIIYNDAFAKSINVFGSSWRNPYKFFKSKVDVLTNFIPQMIFMGCIFIYLCAQMVAKWLFFSVEKGVVLGMEYPGSYCAPSLLIGLINMFMLKERPVGHMMEKNSTAHHPTCYLNQWYPDQDDSEHLLAIDRYLHEHSVMDEFLHQAIHTIEFVLGCVSHTASYLQLSEVLWHMILMPGMSSEGSLLASSVFFFFAVLSLSILVLMEGLSAFLHALRLHWVEFQSKFYQGSGHAFRPYSLQECLETAQHLSEVTEEFKQQT